MGLHMFRHFKCIPTFRLNLVVNNVLLKDTMKELILCSGGCNHLNCFGTVSEWDVPTSRNAGFLLYHFFLPLKMILYFAK